jgi:hypothetical protein
LLAASTLDTLTTSERAGEEDNRRKRAGNLQKGIPPTSMGLLSVTSIIGLQLFFLALLRFIYEVTGISTSPSISVKHRCDVDPILASSVFKVVL